MVNSCCAYDCSSCSDINTELMFHSFPDAVKDKERWQKWVNAVRRKDFTPSASSRLCSLHFQRSDYSSPVICGPPRLKKDAVPSLFSYVDKLKPKRTPIRRRLAQINPGGTTPKEIADTIEKLIVTVPIPTTAKNTAAVPRPATINSTVAIPKPPTTYNTVATQTNLVGVEITNRIERLTQTINQLRREKKCLQQQLRRKETHVNNLNEKLIKYLIEERVILFEDVKMLPDLSTNCNISSCECKQDILADFNELKNVPNRIIQKS